MTNTTQLTDWISNDRRFPTSVSLKKVWPIYFSIALMFTFYHLQTIDRPFWIERSELHQSIIQGEAKSPYQYRVVSPMIAEAGGLIVEKAFSLTDKKQQAIAREIFYSGERLISVFLLFVFFHLLLQAYFPSEIAFAGTLLLGALHIYTYHSYYYQPDSPINLMFLALAMLLMVKKGPGGWLYPLMIVGALTRETFGIVVALHLAYFGLNRRTIKHSLGLFACWLATQLMLHIAYGQHPSYEGRPMSINIAEIPWPIFLYGLMWLIPIFGFRKIPQFFQRSLLLYVPPLIAADFLFGKVEETRLFLDLALIIIPSTLFVLLRSADETSDSDPGPKEHLAFSA